MFWNMNDWNRRMGPRGPMGFRPARRPMRMGWMLGFLPLGGLFILPALMFGGWIVMAVLGSVLGLIGTVIGGVFAGLGALTEVVFSGGGLVFGMILGFAAYRIFRRKQEEQARQEEAETETQEEPVQPRYYRMGE